MPKAKNKFYAVAQGHKPGIYNSWEEAQPQINGTKAVHKSFKTFADAKNWYDGHVSGAGATRSAGASTSRSPYGAESRKKALNAPAHKQGQGAVASGARRAYTDGACPDNGKVTARAGSGVYWNRSDTPNVSERLPGLCQTNQKSELYAICRTLETDPEPEEPLDIFTDSAYSISCLMEWHQKWAERDWKNAKGDAVLHGDLIRYILALLVRHSGRVTFVKVKGHSGDAGNDMADSLAVSGAALPNVLRDRDFAADLKKLEQSAPAEEALPVDFELDDDWEPTAEELAELDRLPREGDEEPED